MASRSAVFRDGRARNSAHSTLSLKEGDCNIKCGGYICSDVWHRAAQGTRHSVEQHTAIKFCLVRRKYTVKR